MLQLERYHQLFLCVGPCRDKQVIFFVFLHLLTLNTKVYDIPCVSAYLNRFACPAKIVSTRLTNMRNVFITFKFLQMLVVRNCLEKYFRKHGYNGVR